MKILGFGNATGSQNWRLADPFRQLAKLGHQTRAVKGEAITEELVSQADIVVLNSVVDQEGIAICYEYQKHRGVKLVVDVDDWLKVDKSSPFIAEHKVTNAPEIREVSIEIADMVTCTTDYLADKIKPFNKNVVVLPNSMDLEKWDLPKLKNTSDKIRIGWAGSVTHMEDLKLIIKPLKKIMDEFPQVQLIFCGETRIADYFKGYPVECVLGVEFDVWPTRLHGLRLDIGLAPLKDTPFNRCKSNIKFQEYAIAQVPGVYSPVVYGTWRFSDFDGRFGDIAETEDQWYMCIRNLIVSKNHREDIINGAYSYVKQFYSLKKNIKLWERAYQSLLT